jgi:hypothetical protein
MSKHDLHARPIYHHIRDSIEAHLTIVFAALAVSHRIEHRTGWSIKKFVRTARRYRTVRINVGQQTLTAEEPPPDDLREAFARINNGHVHQLGPSRDTADVSGRRPAGARRRQPNSTSCGWSAKGWPTRTSLHGSSSRRAPYRAISPTSTTSSASARGYNSCKKLPDTTN